jgi:hypothetical protein
VARHLPNRVVAALFALAVFGSLGPHLLILALQSAGVRPPATLAFFCPLHQSGATSTTIPGRVYVGAPVRPLAPVN